MGTNAGAITIPFQGWRNFKEAFTPEVVEHAIQDSSVRVTRLLDPFGGSGTSGLAAQFLGVRPTLIEVNPYLADLTEAKLTAYDIEELRESYVSLIERAANSVPRMDLTFQSAPKTFVEPGVGGRYIFTKEIARRIWAYRNAIDQIGSPAIRRLFRVMLGSAAVASSNVTISGKGRRYRSRWQQRLPEPGVLDASFRNCALAAIYDIHRFSARQCREYTLLRGDSRQLLESIDPIELAVFSPPYPNSFDYTDVYNVELWALGYLDSAEANLRLRKATLRSHVQIAHDMDGTVYSSPTLKRTVSRLKRVRSKLWNRRIPEMINAYFSDLGDVLQSLSRKLLANGRVYMIVGDSRYANVHIPVADILVEIAPSVGLSLLRREPCRSMRVSPQQGGQRGLDEALLIMEKP